MRNVLIVLFSAFCFVSCSEKQKTNEDDIPMPSRRGTLGEYVYMSSNTILHSKLQCPQLQTEKDDVGHKVVGVEFVDTNEFCPNYQFFYCKYCFNDIKYEQIKGILERNRAKAATKEESDSIWY